MINLPNSLSALRLALASVFLVDSQILQLSAVGMALITDGLDGYLARRWSQTSYLGTILDPIADKIFVLAAVSALFMQGSLPLVGALAFFSRDLAVLLFGAILLLRGQLKNYKIRAFLFGKITTCLQLVALVALLMNFAWSNYFSVGFVVLGLLSFLELLVRKDS